MKKSQAKMDEFAFILLAGLLFIIILTVAWSSLPKPFIEISPEFLSLVAVRGSKTDAVLLFNGSANNVTLRAKGDIANWVKFSKNNFPLAGELELTVSFIIPTSVKIGTYSGSIEIEFDSEKKTIPVTLEVVEKEALSYTTFRFGDFSVSYFSKKEKVASKTDFEISKGYFSNYPSTLVAVVEDFENIKSGRISLVIGETNSEGNLVISFNGKTIFNEKVKEGKIELPIEKDEIKSSNIIKLEAGLPGWKFWMSTVYRIKELNFEIEYEGINFKESTFSLKQYEMENYKWGRITFQLKNRTGTGNLIIKLNDEEIYNSVPNVPLGWYFDVDLGNAKLNRTNKLVFSTQKDSTYELANTVLVLAYSTY